MGRQAYLAKIAFGRSAFEPTGEVTESDEYIQLAASQSDEPLPERYREAKANNYIQLYDERGNPINPRAHAYSKRLRDAQNDVLASVGVVERRRSPAEGLPGSYEERLDELESEETVGNALALASTVVENLCTWWIGSIRDRLLTFRIPDALPFLQVVASERTASGSSIAYTGFTSRLVSTIGIQACVYGAYAYRPIDRLMQLTHASSKTRHFVRRSRSVLTLGFRLGLEVLFYPLSYHANLQRLGLLPARPLLPFWKAFIPFSPWSPLTPLSVHHDAASGSVVDVVKAVLTSPMVIIIAEHFYERLIYSAVFEAVESFIIRPDNADIESPDAISKDRATSILGLQRRSPPLIRDAINKLLVVLGWAEPAVLDEAERKPSLDFGISAGQSVEVAGTQITDLLPVDIPVSRTNRPTTDGANDDTLMDTIPADIAERLVRPTTPPTPPASDNGDNDPRIRITSREGIVEMEVRLPPRVIYSHTEVLDDQRRSSSRNRVTSQRNDGLATRPHHRVTQLSTEPSQMIGAIVKAQLVGITVLPFKLVVLRLVASHYLASQDHGGTIPRFVESFPNPSDMSLRSLGIGISRVALCAAFELAIDLSLWSAQYLAVTTAGKSIFGWGAL
ncbi:uncharacterized protein M421DRAFT_419361 [Didymella exigua CBS 183.55]|uniref:Uncharacterized protein n=1 Tax=Didymella exigua CBS 183.55 TaxID=1150837 RepID=A0A6A5RTB4_9PLEO|nr:uncharacterized protein M421DRAFT_419361 [Didymella exigua CBS 183.55]KAF1929566.1 hypothetical protein M421DRAFT_419361 [Didymella exigua CBS 183.55]